ncbi:MAG: nicotinate phosphoribosyltransferase [Methanobrevibacter sp.]
MIENNICLLTDSYKITHHYFYPKGTEKIYSYLENRTGAEFNKTIFYGLQYILKKYLVGNVVTEEKVEEANDIMKVHLGEGIFNYDDWMYIARELDGKLPIEIKAVPEGTPVNVSNVLMTVENTDKRCFWLTNYLEPLLQQVWYPSTVATLSAEVKKLCNFYLDVTGSSKDNLPFMLHDFGYRGASSTESAKLCSSAHLLSFSGTDTLVALTVPPNYYNTNEIEGFSVQATEHSVMTAEGQDNELKQAVNVVKSAHNGILSVVIDSYDYKNFLKNACFDGYELNDEIKKFLDKDPGNKIVFRPDSGEPVSTTIDCLEIIEEGFGTHLNDAGYKVFNANIGVLWGDGLNYHKIRDILFGIKAHKWAAENILFGMGGGLHSDVTRDTQRTAFKCSAQYRNGKWFDIFKKPLDNSKKSKKGRLKLLANGENFKTVPIDAPGEDVLRTVFKDGELLVDDNFNDIKLRTSKYNLYPLNSL